MNIIGPRSYLSRSFCYPRLNRPWEKSGALIRCRRPGFDARCPDPLARLPLIVHASCNKKWRITGKSLYRSAGYGAEACYAT